MRKAITIMPSKNLNLSWAYGVTTVPGRFDTLLPRTLNCLTLAGFPSPRLFIDGCKEEGLPGHLICYEKTLRYPRIRAYGNWILALGELFIRNPTAHRYAIFQDDFVTYRNLKYYLDNIPYPERGYCNLYTFPSNQTLAPKDGSTGWYPSDQQGKGAVALVFNRDAAFKILTHEHMVNKPHGVGIRSWKNIDGGVVDAMKKSGWKEYVHNPSLVQHTGLTTSMEGPHPRHLQAVSFRGEDYDAREMLG